MARKDYKFKLVILYSALNVETPAAQDGVAMANALAYYVTDTKRSSSCGSYYFCTVLFATSLSSYLAKK